MEKWQVPACGPCNLLKSQVEQRAWLLLALAIDQDKPGAAGVTKRAFHSIDATRGRDPRDIERRKKLRAWLESTMFQAGPEHIPSTVPFSLRNFQMGVTWAMHIDSDELTKLVAWWVRGFHFYMTGRYIEPPAEINAAFLPDSETTSILKPMWHLAKDLRCGRGMLIRQFFAELDGRMSAIYFFKIWNQFTVYGLVS